MHIVPHTITIIYGRVEIMFLAGIKHIPWLAGCCRTDENKFRFYRVMNLLFLRLINIFTVHKVLEKRFVIYTTFAWLARASDGWILKLKVSERKKYILSSSTFISMINVDKIQILLIPCSDIESNYLLYSAVVQSFP